MSDEENIFEMPPHVYLRHLADRIHNNVPPMYDVDQEDCDRLRDIASTLDPAVLEADWSDIPDYADVMSVDEWLHAVECGGFIDYDGHGYYVRDDKMDRNQLAKPSTAKEQPPKEGYTHVAWFNR
jgi:hypothetical protein